MSYSFRSYDPSQDLPQVVDFYNEVFAPLRPYYSWPISIERFTDKVLSHWEFRPAGLQLAYDGKQLIGFVLAAFRGQSLIDIDTTADESSPVFISAIAVAPGYRRRGVGRMLTERTGEFAKNNGRDCVVIGTNPMAPMAFFLGVQDDWRIAHHFFRSVGFSTVGINQNMIRSIIGYQMDEPVRNQTTMLRAEGYECRAYKEEDYDMLVELLDEHGWTYWHLDMLSKVGVWTKTRPFIETCFLDCSTDHIYGPDEVGVVVKDGKMLSFCAQVLNPETGKAYLGPMLTAAAARGMGLGTVSLQISLELASRKDATVCDLWTGVDGHITHFYKKSGFQQMINWFEFEMKL